MKIRNILIPTDFSDSAESALTFASEMALSLKARIIIMHSVKSTFSFASERLAEQLNKDDRLKNLEIETILETGDPALSTLNQSEEKKADMIIMGSKGRSGGRNLLGSTTIEIISKSPIPVLAIPQKAIYSGFENMVFTTNYHDGDLENLIELVSFAKLFNSKLHVLHIDPEKNFEAHIKFTGFRELAGEKIDYMNIIFKQIFNPSFYDGIEAYLKNNHIKLLTITRYKKTFFQKLTEKDHTKEMGININTPLLTLIGET